MITFNFYKKIYYYVPESTMKMKSVNVSQSLETVFYNLYTYVISIIIYKLLILQ